MELRDPRGVMEGKPLAQPNSPLPELHLFENIRVRAFGIFGLVVADPGVAWVHLGVVVIRLEINLCRFTKNLGVNE